MLSNKYKKPLNLKLIPSKTLFYFIIAIHFLAVYTLTLPLDIHIIFLLLVFIFIGVSLFVSLKNNGFIQREYWIDKIETLTDMEWRLQSSSEKSLSAELQNNWFSLPLMLILYFKIAEGKTRAIIILPDMINRNDFRELKLYLNKFQ